MNAYLLGNLMGRLAVSYVVIWFIVWVTIARLNWRDTFRRAHHWSGLVATVTLFLIGLIAAQSSNGGAP